MPISWLAILKIVPWGDVISNAPKVADGAKKLWKSVAKKPPAAELPTTSEQPTLLPEAQSITLLQAQLATAKAEVSELHSQMLESSKLINALADQNAHLIKRLEINRIRVLWLAGTMVVLGVVSAINLAITVTR
jgi:hypothetical protein